MIFVAIACENSDFMSYALEADRRVYHQSLSAPDAEIRVDEDDSLRVGRRLCGHVVV